HGATIYSYGKRIHGAHVAHSRSLSFYLVAAQDVASTTFNWMFGLANEASHNRTAVCRWAKGRPAKWCASTPQMAPGMGGDMLLLVLTCTWRCADDLVLARRAVQPADNREGAGLCGHRHPDACAGYRREHHDIQLDQLHVAESNSRTGQSERGGVADAEQARGQALRVYIS